ncbi:hypothetical protein SAMN04488589_0271 [Methanolobus vulcani]|uniref:Uncharacterized protein n=1 Tax=Methanolobus vulcani TaxID=38026 RepID=A0A7Z7FD73_9EURY|nr:hypothetical protein SAMN04488589_0271 [Methanolobus vulcani]
MEIFFLKEANHNLTEPFCLANTLKRCIIYDIVSFPVILVTGNP